MYVDGTIYIFSFFGYADTLLKTSEICIDTRYYFISVLIDVTIKMIISYLAQSIFKEEKIVIPVEAAHPSSGIDVHHHVLIVTVFEQEPLVTTYSFDIVDLTEIFISPEIPQATCQLVVEKDFHTHPLLNLVRINCISLKHIPTI